QLEGMQTVSTYSVALAQNLPSYELDVNGNRVTFVPVCQANTNGSLKLDQTGWTDCSFVDARVEYQDAHGGSMYVSWEDSLWGNDFDMDVVSRIEWCIGDIGNSAEECPGEPQYADYGSGYSYNDFKWKTGNAVNDD